MKKMIYKIYKKMEKNRLIASCFHFLYGNLIPFLTGKYKPIKYNPKEICFAKRGYSAEKKALKDLKIAVICDDMTYKNLEGICNVYFLTPDNWIEVMQKEQPDLFFCEAAWSGIAEYKDAWRGKIYKNQRLLFENRTMLLNILDYCKRNGIKTVFWNKEDPYFFDDVCHNFGETALLFEYIFTTAEELVERYESRGHSRVFVMGFGFSPALYHCGEDVEKENKAVFAGSWYADIPERCEDMEKIFDMLIEKKIPLEIYDRYWDSDNPMHRFPEKYRPYIHKSVPYEALGQIYKTARFAVNINTEKNSDTMYARRVHELMACRCVVISNESKGMRKKFGEHVWFLDTPFDFENERAICEDNYDYVMNHCTNREIFKGM
ncbi:MAG: hypothetical protein ACI4TP_00835, partial [Anaerotignum sp.]